jgi:thiol-disulfide isomerase/thioredoxin
VIVTGIGMLSIVFSTLDEGAQPPTTTDTGTTDGTTTTTNTENVGQVLNIDKSRFKTAPDIVGIAHYLNTTPEELAQEIEGKVVLYDIWTYSCINCIRTLPYITAWDDKYADQGLLIIGIHSPEFEFEKDPQNVQMAMEKHGITYPVVLDNDKETWKAFENRYWPRKYIADNEGYIRYDHIGEGAYKETEQVIQDLLKERALSMGIQAASAESLVDIEEFEHSLFRTPELYFGYYFAQNRNQLGNQEGFQPGRIVSYAPPTDLELHKFYVIGDWLNLDGSMKLVSETGTIKLLYIAKQVNIVTEDNADLEIILDESPLQQEHAGTDITPGTNILQTSGAGLYNIISSDASSLHTLEIRVTGQDFQMFTFTFG